MPVSVTIDTMAIASVDHLEVIRICFTLDMLKPEKVNPAQCALRHFDLDALACINRCCRPDLSIPYATQTREEPHESAGYLLVSRRNRVVPYTIRTKIRFLCDAMLDPACRNERELHLARDTFATIRCGAWARNNPTPVDHYPRPFPSVLQ